ncbi:MAG: hypothetical protein KF857_07435 [Fimbriimonadaceae bacterium]|nr:hypothetical protein [Fimbriimonadaceae bacterium]
MTAVFLAAAAVAFGNVEMTIAAPGVHGRAVVRQSITDKGHKSLRLEMTLRDKDGKVRVVVQESDYDKQARPVSMTQKTSIPGGNALQTLTVRFSETKATVVVEEAGHRNETTVPAPSKPWRATPEFWFVRDKVEPGGETTYWRFDLASQKWVETKCVYVGRRKVRAGGKEYDAHCVLMGGVKSYLDDKGDPVRLESGRLVMERT